MLLLMVMMATAVVIMILIAMMANCNYFSGIQRKSVVLNTVGPTIVRPQNQTVLLS